MLGLSVFRLVCGVAIGFGLSALLGMHGLPRAVLILQCSMPVAVYSYLLAQVWKTDPEQIAALVMVSTLLTLAVLPVILAVLLPG